MTSQAAMSSDESLSAVVVGTKEHEVWESLAAVTDPELDESVTALGFVTTVSVKERAVFIGFHLPTYWCAANFAYMMASDMHRAAMALPWVTSVCVELDEHMYSETINRGIAASLSFQDTFGDEANDEIHVVRDKFRRKAFQQRQELVIRYLLARHHTVESIVALRMFQLDVLPFEDDEGQQLSARYREIRQEFGGACESDNFAFVRLDGVQLAVDTFDQYLLELRSVRINTQFNGEICRGLLAARYGQSEASPTEVRVAFPALEEQQARDSLQGT